MRYEIFNGTKVCALFNFIGTINILKVAAKQSESGQMNAIEIHLKNITTSMNKASNCQENKTLLVLDFTNSDGEKGKLSLQLDHLQKIYELSQIDLEFANIVYQSNKREFQIDDTKSYLCLANSETDLSVKGTNQTAAVIELSDLKVDAFRQTDSKEFRQGTCLFLKESYYKMLIF